jgi:hypothetical protein
VGKRKEVDAWFKKCTNPLKVEMQRVREILLAADERLDECIKWQAPTFVFNGNLASFNPRSKAHVSLLFHSGAKIPGKHPGLEGRGDTARVMKIVDPEKSKKALEIVARAWCEWREES